MCVDGWQLDSLVGSAEAEASRISAAGRAADEGREALEAALEQSRHIVHYTSHAAEVPTFFPTFPPVPVIPSTTME